MPLHYPSFMLPNVKSRPVGAYVAGLVLVAFFAVGFWHYSDSISGMKLLQQGELFFLLCLIFSPMVLFLFVMMIAIRQLEYNRLSGSYQVRIDQLQKRLNWQEDLLELVANNDPEAVTIFDNQGRFWFVNESAAKQYGAHVKDLIGSPVSKIVGPERARVIEARLQAVRMSSQPIETLERSTDNIGQPSYIQTKFERVAAFGEFAGGVIARTENVTNLVVERERREDMLRQVIATLVAVVDRRDPYAAGHSQRVGLLSRAIAEEMVMNEKDIETAEIAGSLMNFGKVLVPREILTKTTALTDEELRRVRDSILTSADILSIINFSGPVVPTLRQVLERFDGTGSPHGLKGNGILMTARIVAVANAYIALVSARAHRAGLSLDDALARLKEETDKAFDRRVVAALDNYIHNRASKLDWLNGAPKLEARA